MTASCFTSYLNEKRFLLCETESPEQDRVVSMQYSHCIVLSTGSRVSPFTLLSLPQLRHKAAFPMMAACPKFISSRKIKTRETSPSRKKRSFPSIWSCHFEVCAQPLTNSSLQGSARHWSRRWSGSRPHCALWEEKSIVQRMSKAMQLVSGKLNLHSPATLLCRSCDYQTGSNQKICRTFDVSSSE